MLASVCCLCVQAKLMSECSGSINSVKRVKLILNDDEELDDAGLTSSTTNKQIGTGMLTELRTAEEGVMKNETSVNTACSGT